MRKISKSIGIFIVVATILIFAVPGRTKASVVYPICYDPVGVLCWFNATHTGNGVTTAREYSGEYPVFGAPLSASTTGDFDSINGTTGSVYPGFYFLDYGGGDYRVYQYTGSGDISANNLFDVTSRFIDVFPIGIVATGTSVIGFSAYINSDDFAEDSYFSFIITPLDAIAISDSEELIFSGAVGDDFMFATTSGMFYFSTTTDFQVLGNYKIEGRFYRADCGVFGFTPGFCMNELFATTTRFVVATTSAFRNVESQIDSYIRQAIASTTLEIGNVCSPFSSGFSIVPCLVTLIVPTSDVIKSDVEKLKTLPPWGYGFRFYDIFTSNTKVALPTVELPVPGASVALNLTPWAYLFGSSSPLTAGEAKMTLNGVDYGSEKSFREIVEPFWNYLWVVVLGFAIVMKLFGIRGNSSEINELGGVGNKPYGPQK